MKCHIFLFFWKLYLSNYKNSINANILFKFGISKRKKFSKDCSKVIYSYSDENIDDIRIWNICYNFLILIENKLPEDETEYLTIINCSDMSSIKIKNIKGLSSDGIIIFIKYS